MQLSLKFKFWVKSRVILFEFRFSESPCLGGKLFVQKAANTMPAVSRVRAYLEDVIDPTTALTKTVGHSVIKERSASLASTRDEKLLEREITSVQATTNVKSFLLP
jgi:hypothetical protein